MKKNFSLILTIIMCVLFGISIIQISTLKKEVTRLRTELDNETYRVNQDISNIYGNVQEMLEEESNQFAVSEWEYGEINVEDKTAEVLCTVIPKMYTPETTQAGIVCNGQEWPMIYDGGQYTVLLVLLDNRNIQRFFQKKEKPFRKTLRSMEKVMRTLIRNTSILFII